MDDFDLPSDVATAPRPKDDPRRPGAVRGRYYLPHPVTGERTSWQRVTNFVKNAEDTYNLELWKQRNVAKGLAMRPDLLARAARFDVKADRRDFNELCAEAQDVAGAYKASDEGTKLHESAELAHFAHGRLDGVPQHHHGKIQLMLDMLWTSGLAVAEDMIERVTVSQGYEVAGKLDLITTAPDGSNFVTDLKTGSSLDLAFPSIAAQLACYQDGINHAGIWDGARYDTSRTVRTDVGLVIHLPSDRDEVSLWAVDLAAGHAINRVCLAVRQARQVQARDVAQPFQAALYGLSADEVHQGWLERMNAAHTVTQLMAVRDRARALGQWDERLAGQARLLATDLAWE